MTAALEQATREGLAAFEAEAATLGLGAVAAQKRPVFRRRIWARLCAEEGQDPGPFRVLSYGGGLDSFAMLILALERGEHLDLVIFADVGDPQRLDPAEWPGTYRHIEEVVRPLCERVGLPFVWLDTSLSPIRGQRSLFAYFQAKRLMPSRLSRLCTSAAKVERIRAYVVGVVGELASPAGAPLPVEMWIGFEAGEEVRAEKDPHAEVPPGAAWRSRFPLLEADLCRCRAELLVRRSGHPVPRKSACVYCPFGSRRDFQTLQRELPGTFRKVQALEDDCRKTKRGKTIRFSGSDETDPRLSAWVASPFRARRITCPVCGRERATKETACGWLDEPVREAEAAAA